jgi:ankyrin repeat protein
MKVYVVKSSSESLFHDPTSSRHIGLEILSFFVILHLFLPFFHPPDNCFIEVTALYLYVTFAIGHTAQVCLLLKHRADQHLRDSEGIESLDIAVREANADIVTL